MFNTFIDTIEEEKFCVKEAFIAVGLIFHLLSLWEYPFGISLTSYDKGILGILTYSITFYNILFSLLDAIEIFTND